MKFKEAFDKAWDMTPQENRPRGDNNIPKILAFFWTMVALSEQNGKIVLDDTVYINSNNVSVSKPVQKSDDEGSGEEDSEKTEKAAPKTKNSVSTEKGGKGKNAAKDKKDTSPSPVPVDDKVTGDDGAERPENN